MAALRREIEQIRADARSEREALRAAHTDQLAQIQRNADERATALNRALSLARETAETYRAIARSWQVVAIAMPTAYDDAQARAVVHWAAISTKEASQQTSSTPLALAVGTYAVCSPIPHTCTPSIHHH